MKRDPISPRRGDIVIQPISHDVLAEKYLKPGETGIDDLFQRVARAWRLSNRKPTDPNTRHCSSTTCTPAPLARAAS